MKHYTAIIIAYLIWAAAGPIIKLTLNSVPVFTFLLFRFLIVCCALLPYLYIQLKKIHIHPSDLGKIIILGLLSQSSLVLIFYGFKYTSALDATLIGVMGPILAVAAGHYLYREKINKNIKLGLGVATLGTLYIAIEPLFELQTNNHLAELRLLGNGFVILYTLAFLLYMIWSKMMLGKSSKPMLRTLKYLHIKPMKRHYSATLLTALTFYVGLLTFIPFVILENMGYLGFETFDIKLLGIVPVLGILYMALLSSIVAYTLFEWGLEKVDVKDTAILSYLAPLLTAPFAFIILGEVPTTYMVIGGLTLALGVYLAEKHS